MRNFERSLALVLSCGLIYQVLAQTPLTASPAASVVPTPTWTAAQEKAYHSRMQAYLGACHKAPPKQNTYVCAFCGYTSDQRGNCPKCSCALGLYDPNAKSHNKLYSPDHM